MKRRTEIKRKRIIVYYILAIVLPCLILGILAFRGIKNDQALIEKEHRNNLAEASREIIQETNAYLLSVENDFVKLVDTITPPQRIIFTDSLLNRFIDQQKIIAGIFVISPNSLPNLLNNGLLYIPDSAAITLDKTDIQTTQKFQNRGWKYEFKEKKYKRALEYYQSVLPDVTEEQSGGEILNAIARIQKKLELVDEAIETYDLILNQYPMIFIQERIPLGTVALLEKSLLHLKKIDSLSAIGDIQLLLSQILESKWEFGFSIYTLILSEADERISGYENSDNLELNSILKEVYSIRDRISESEAHTEYLLSFLNSEITLIEQDPILPTSIKRQNVKINSYSYFWSLRVEGNKEQWGLIFDTDYFLENIIKPLVVKKAKASNFCWEILDENGRLLLQSDSNMEHILPVYTSFPSSLPSFALKFYPEKTGLMVSFFNSREGLFLYIYIVITIILVFGLVFTLRSINNEIQFSKMKSFFMSTVSHEFKSPLTSIRQMAEMLVRDRVPSTERKKKYYNMILQQSERLSHLVENILDFSKMEVDQKVFRFKKDSISKLVKDVVISFQNNMADLGIQINLSNGDSISEVVFDKESMEQVMYNLLDNACKYSGDSKTINVEITSQSNDIVIDVTDYGVGICKEDQDKIFDRFYRSGDELTQTVTGSGIGLTIVKQIVAAHKGEVQVESSPGKGSKFSIILPIA